MIFLQEQKELQSLNEHSAEIKLSYQKFIYIYKWNQQ